jgi:hypothetical protein
MPDLHPSEDKATLYVLGGLTETERREFETELAQSAELRALVRELEESAVLLARSSPQRRPPSAVWQAIRKSAAAEPKPEKIVPAFWTVWSGWAAAAACLVGWLLYAAWVNHSTALHAPGAATPIAVSQMQAGSGNNPSGPNLTKPRSTNRPDQSMTPSADALELIRLRHQVTDLQARVSGLSHSVAQQQALLGETNRLKFFQMTSASGDAGTASFNSLSPALQRAIFLAMARELGWTSADASAPGAQNQAALLSNPTNVDFLDLRTATNSVANAPQEQSNNPPPPRTTSENSPVANSARIAIPAFASGNNVIVAIDQSIVPAGTQLNFLNQDQQPIGATVLGDNPVVVAIPMPVNGGTIFITTGSMSAPISVFQYFNPSAATP